MLVMISGRGWMYRKRSRAILKSVMKMDVGDDFWESVCIILLWRVNIIIITIDSDKQVAN